MILPACLTITSNSNPRGFQKGRYLTPPSLLHLTKLGSSGGRIPYGLKAHPLNGLCSTSCLHLETCYYLLIRCVVVT